MKGKHHIIIDAPRLRYEFEIKRNITILQGESASGKTTLIDLLTDYASNKDNSPIRIMSDVPCEVYIAGGERWQPVLQSIENSIVFIDEGNPFIRSKEAVKY